MGSPLIIKSVHSRGGSDITGSIVAAGVKADLYENFTDVDGIFAAHPGVVHEPHSIPELTYKEMRELAYAGFSVLHDEALLPAYRGKIPLVIKNTQAHVLFLNTREQLFQLLVLLAMTSLSASI